MEVDDYINETDVEKAKFFVEFIKNSNCTATVNEKAIDNLFDSAVVLQNSFLQDRETSFKQELIKLYPNVNFEKSVELLMEIVLKSQFLSDSLTLYSVKKYISLYSGDDFCKILQNLHAEVMLRKHLVKLNEDLPDVTLDWLKINNLVDEVLNDVEPRIVNVLKTQTLDLLNGVKHASSLKGHCLIDKIINCLNIQEDLKLWFIIMNTENLQVVLDLCIKFNDFLQAVLTFFDEYANEVESNYDEDLNVKYSHLNSDFEEFVNIFRLFLNNNCLSSVICDYLDKKTSLEDKNFTFWIDVKACL